MDQESQGPSSQQEASHCKSGSYRDRLSASYAPPHQLRLLNPTFDRFCRNR